MKSILLRLYDGEICPAEQFNLKTEEYRSMRQAHYQHYEDFIEQLKSLDPPLHKKFIPVSYTHLHCGEPYIPSDYPVPQHPDTRAAL